MRRIRPAAAILGVFILLSTVAVGIILVINFNIAPTQAASPPAPLVLGAVEAASTPSTAVIETEQEVHTEIEQVNPTGIFVDYEYLPWNLTLVNRYNILPANFEPYLAYIGNGHYFDARAADSLLLMLESARSQGLSPLVVSAHRSIARQTMLFERQLNRRLDQGMAFDDAFDAARRVVAYPGESEHNLGLAVDIVATHYLNLTPSFGQTPEGLWLAQNSHRYGFVLRYPYHKQDITNIIYEPWHFRYVGVPHATEMFERDLVLEEYVEMLIFRD